MENSPLIYEYLDSRPLSASTRAKYIRVLALFYVDFPQGAAMLTTTELRQWLERPNWGLNSQWIALNAMRGFLRFHYGETHPALRLRIKRAPRPPREGLVLGQLSDLLVSFNTSTPKGRRDLAMTGVFVDCALRVSEMSRLRLAEVDLRARRLSVIVKGGQWNRRGFSMPTALWLDAWLADRAGLARPDATGLFVAVGGNYPGRDLTTEGVKEVVQSWSKQTGMKLYPHRFRHTFATEVTRLGAPKSIAMRGGGWENERVFDGYIQGLAVEDMEPYYPVAAVMK